VAEWLLECFFVSVEVVAPNSMTTVTVTTTTRFFSFFFVRVFLFYSEKVRNEGMGGVGSKFVGLQINGPY
jgi:hypothetical protein